MDLRQFMLDVFTRLEYELGLVLNGLTQEEITYRPGPNSNSIGWLIWHSARSQDRMNADLFSEDQLWVSGKWHARFSRPPNQKDTGMGHTLEQIAAFHAPDAATLLEYYRTVAARTRDYINSRLTEADLTRQVYSPTLESTATVEARLIGVINNFQHIGQAGYVRGMLKGKGWYVA